MTLFALLFHYTGPVFVNFEHARYLVEESSGLCTVTIVTSYPPRFSFKVKLAVLLSRHQTAGEYGKYAGFK